MTERHPLLTNIDAWLVEEADKRVRDLTRILNEEIIERHGQRLFSDHSLIMTGQECTVRGHPVIARRKEFKEFAKAELLYDLEPWTIKALAEEMALEYEYFELDFAKRLAALGYEPFLPCPYRLAMPYLSVDPHDFEPIVRFGYRSGAIPLNKSCPPCDVTEDADLTKFGLPPLK